jgi:deoxyribonuclease-1
VNGDRSNFKYGMIPGEDRNYGQCDFEVDFKNRVAEPRESVRGDLARINFYMTAQYGLTMSSQQKTI